MRQSGADGVGKAVFGGTCLRALVVFRKISYLDLTQYEIGIKHIGEIMRSLCRIFTPWGMCGVSGVCGIILESLVHSVLKTRS